VCTADTMKKLSLLWVSCIVSIGAVHDSLNFALAPSKRECFYEDFGINDQREVEAFVNSGGLLDISLYIYGPLTVDEIRAEKFDYPIREEKIDAEKQQISETQTLTFIYKPEIEGTYAFCLDNRYDLDY
jgi:hypothetical protein